MAHKKGSGNTKNGRDSISKRLGLKHFGGNFIKSGNIILRQRGLTFKSGKNIGCGKDFTLFAEKTGFLFFKKSKKLKSCFIK